MMININNFHLHRTFNLHFTDFCNFKCKHCFVKKDSKQLSLSQIKEIVNKISDYQISKKVKCRINLAGGEPLCCSYIQEIIDYINQNNIEASIITNGYLLDGQFITRNKNKLSMIGISIDSFDETINRFVGRTCNNKYLSFGKIKCLCDQIKSANIKLKINCCVTKLNLKSNIPLQIKELKPDRVKFLKVITNHLNESLRNHFEVNDSEWLDFCSKYKDLTNEIVFEDNDYMKNNYIIIDSEGNVSRNNCHTIDNNLLKQSLNECLFKLEKHSCEIEPMTVPGVIFNDRERSKHNEQIIEKGER